MVLTRISGQIPLAGAEPSALSGGQPGARPRSADGGRRRRGHRQGGGSRRRPPRARESVTAIAGHSAPAAAPVCRAPALDAAAPRRAGITFGAGGATGLRRAPAPPPAPAPILPWPRLRIVPERPDRRPPRLPPRGEPSPPAPRITKKDSRAACGRFSAPACRSERSPCPGRFTKGGSKYGPGPAAGGPRRSPKGQPMTHAQPRSAYRARGSEAPPGPPGALVLPPGQGPRGPGRATGTQSPCSCRKERQTCPASKPAPRPSS